MPRRTDSANTAICGNSLRVRLREVPGQSTLVQRHENAPPAWLADRDALNAEPGAIFATRFT